MGVIAVPAPTLPSALLVVHRTETKLYQYIRRSFATYPDVQVMLDRRRGERRQTTEAAVFERRRSERRSQRIDKLLLSRGWALAHRRVIP